MRDNISTKQFLIVLSLGLFFLAGECASPWAPAFCKSFISTPSWMNTKSVAQKMVVNSLESKVMSFEADRTVEEILDFYRREWDERFADKEGYREMIFGQWHIISRLQGSNLYTVQAREISPFKTTGYLAVADLKNKEKNKRKENDIPRMNGSEIIDDSTSYDQDKMGRTTMVANHFSVSVNSKFYRDYYTNRRWTTIQDQTLMESQVLAFSQGRKKANLVIRKTDNGSVVVINQVFPE